MTKKKIAIIGTDGLPANYGGFETLTYYLVDNLAKEYDITVYCSKTPKDKKLKAFNFAKLIYFPLKANGWQSVLYDCITITHAYIYSETLIILGFSGAFVFPLNKLFRKNIIFNIGGIEWKKVRGIEISAKFEVFIKRWMEKLCVRNSNSVIIDNTSFNEYLTKEYGIKPVLAEYGGNHAVSSPITDDIRIKYPFVINSFDLTVSRAQEDMNIHLIIEAYKSIPQRTLVVISNWQISEYGKKLYSENRDKYSNIFLLPAIYELSIINAIRGHCELYIHSHSLCGTAPSLVEAMSLNLPVIAYDVAANRATTEEKALYFKDSSSLIKILINLDKSEIEKIRNSMLDISTRRYNWERISNIYKSCI